MDRTAPIDANIPAPPPDPGLAFLRSIAVSLLSVGSPRLPTQWAGRRIQERLAYVMEGEVTVGPVANLDMGANVGNPFLHAVDKPFEIHSVKATATLLDGAAVPIADPAPDINEFWRVTIVNFTREQNITKTNTMARALFDQNTRAWFWEVPTVLVNSEGLRVNVQSIVAAGGNNLRVSLSFRGFLLVLGEKV